MEKQEENRQEGTDMNTVFEMLKENMPMPDEAVKDAILKAFTYVLSM